MKPLDKNYLSLQFWNKIHTKNGSEFQSFFEDIMQKAFPDFQKIRPYGKEGDRGNDGYIKRLGAFYQVYAPNTPAIKESNAAKKLEDDFNTLKTHWDEIQKVKKYYFVYNDKNIGSTHKLEETITLLEKYNPDIEFEIFNAKKLEITFFELDEAEILNLGFNIDSRQAISNAYEYLEQVELALDREQPIFAFNIHSQVDSIIKSLKDNSLELEYELLKGRCLQKLEKIPDAKDCFENLAKRYLNDPRPKLYLAEIYLRTKEFKQNKLLLEETDHNHWLHKLEELVRTSNLNENIDILLIDEESFSDNPRIKSSFYRLYTGFYEKAGDTEKAYSFIEKAIHLNQNRFSNYEVKLSIAGNRLFTTVDKNENYQADLNAFLEEIEKVEKRFSELGEIRSRSKASLLFMKLNVYRIQEDIKQQELLIKKIFELILNCYFDLYNEKVLVGILWGTNLPKRDLINLLDYLRETKIKISDELSQSLIVQFNIYNTLFDEGKKFFSDIRDRKY